MQEREYKKLHTKKKKENCPHFNFYSVFASHVQPDWICNSLTSPSPTSWCSTAALSSLGFDLSCMFSKFDFPRKKKTKRQCCRVACYTSKERDCSDRMVFTSWKIRLESIKKVTRTAQPKSLFTFLSCLLRFSLIDAIITYIYVTYILPFLPSSRVHC